MPWSDFESRIGALSPRQRRLLSRRLEEAATGISDERVTHAVKSLVAFVVTRKALSADELRQYLLQRLPDYMVPPTFVFVDALPLTSTGKVDKEGLRPPKPASTESKAVAAPRSEVEKTLSAIWAEVLGFDEVGPDDNFFEMGGDSLVSIRILARARQAGLLVTPKQFFDAPTVSGMAAAAVSATSATGSETGGGDIPLTPIQHWFFEQDFPDRHHWNQELIVEMPRELALELIGEAFRYLVSHHDALRLKFQQDGSKWRQTVADPPSELGLQVVDLTRIAEHERPGLIREKASELHASFDLGEGLLIRAALFTLDGGDDRLLLAAHHLAVDGVSWTVLLDDLHTVCQQLRDGRAASLPATTPFALWAKRLKEHAESNELSRERDHWLALEDLHDHELPVDFPEGRAKNRVSESETISVLLSRDETAALVRGVARARHMAVNEVLMTALARSLMTWSGRSALAVDVEGHGRESIAELDVSQTVGWFTTVYTARVELEPGASPHEALESVKRQLRSIPNGGFGLGVLRYLHPDSQLRRRLQAIPRSDVLFNYLGELGGHLARHFPHAKAESRQMRSARGRRPYLLEINAWIEDGVLAARWSFSLDVYRSQTIHAAADSFRSILRELAAHPSSEGGGHVPTDFPLADLDQDELERVARLLDDEQ